MGDLAALAAALGGLPVLGCLAGSPAAEAGLRYGDVLLSVDGIPTRSWDDFIEARSKSGGSIVARIFREGAEMDVAIPLRASGSSPAAVLAELASRFGSDETN